MPRFFTMSIHFLRFPFHNFDVSFMKHSFRTSQCVSKLKWKNENGIKINIPRRILKIFTNNLWNPFSFSFRHPTKISRKFSPNLSLKITRIKLGLGAKNKCPYYNIRLSTISLSKPITYSFALPSPISTWKPFEIPL